MPTARPAAAPAAVWLLAGLIFAATDPVLVLLARGPDDWAPDLAAANAARKPVWAAIYVCAALALWRWRREAAVAARGLAWLLPALGWFAASCLWSPAPADSAFGFAQFALLLGAGLALGAGLGAEAAARALLLAALAALAGSALMAAASPPHAFGQQVNPGALRGLYGQKTHLAVILSYGAAAALFLPMRPGARLAALGALAAGILAARSSIALMQLALLGGIAAAGAGLAGARYAGAAALAGALAAAAGLAAALPAALAALGEDASLNGRLPLWAALWPSAEARPLAGHGFAAFWTTPQAEAIRASLGWNARGAHSGWMTALLAGGVVGVALWLALWGQAAARAASALAPGAVDPGRAALAAAAAAHLLWSLFESNQLMQMNVHALIAGLCLSLPAAARARPAAGRVHGVKSGAPVA